MTTDINPVAVQLQAKMNAVDSSTSLTKLTVLNKLYSRLKIAGVVIDRVAFDAVLANEISGVDSATSELDLMKLASALEDQLGSSGGNVERFVTSGSYSFVVPDGVHILKVSGCGAGGSGAGALGSSSNPGNYSGGGGSGGRSVIDLPFFVVPGETLSITVGVKGIKKAAGVTTGNHGGATTIIGSIDSLYLDGGIRGAASTAVAQGGGDDHPIGDYFVIGGDGGRGNSYSNTASSLGYPGEGTSRFKGGRHGSSSGYTRRSGGGGGASWFSEGGLGGDGQNTTYTGDGGDASGPGAGGGGGARLSGVGNNTPGGDGGDGFLNIRY